MNYAEKIAEAALEIGAIKLSPEEPFTWASGYRMPIYNDNRLLLGRAAHRQLIATGMQALIEEASISYDVIAGIATAGIAPATSLADKIEASLIYVRPKPKEHGMQNQVEGAFTAGAHALLVEDVVSTGGSSMQAAEALRREGGKVDTCLCIFTYGFGKAVETFSKHQCALHPLLDFETLLNFAEKTGAISDTACKQLHAWKEDPFGWGEANGFPPKN